jgi:hypothetical protein
MPSVSRSQQRLFGMVHAYQKGRLPHASAEVRKVAKGIGHKDAKDFAATKHKGLPGHTKRAADTVRVVLTDREAGAFAGGVLAACLVKGASYEQFVTALNVAAGDRFEKAAAGGMAAMPKLQGMNNIGDPNAWGVPPGQKPPKPGQGQPQGGQAPGGPAMPPGGPPGEEGALPVDPNKKNQHGVAPLPHRYNFNLDSVVDRIKKDQLAYAQKKSREAQSVQHYAGTTPQAAQQTQQHMQHPSTPAAGGGQQQAKTASAAEVTEPAVQKPVDKPAEQKKPKPTFRQHYGPALLGGVAGIALSTAFRNRHELFGHAA